MTAPTTGRRAHAAATNPDGQSARSICNWYWIRRLTMRAPAITYPGIAR